MNREMPIQTGKLVVQFVCVLLLLPIVYVAASGPVLVAAAKQHGIVEVSGMPITSRFDFPRVRKPTFVETLYTPLFRLATTTGLQPKLSAYLRFWGAGTQQYCAYQTGIVSLKANPTGAPAWH